MAGAPPAPAAWVQYLVGAKTHAGKAFTAADAHGQWRNKARRYRDGLGPSFDNWYNADQAIPNFTGPVNNSFPYPANDVAAEGLHYNARTALQAAQNTLHLALIALTATVAANPPYPAFFSTYVAHLDGLALVDRNANDGVIRNIDVARLARAPASAAAAMAQMPSGDEADPSNDDGANPSAISNAAPVSDDPAATDGAVAPAGDDTAARASDGTADPAVPVASRADGQVDSATAEEPSSEAPDTNQDSLATDGPPASLTEASSWVGAWELGKGTFGIASLWVKERRSRIVDRVVCKDIKQNRSAFWTQPDYWIKDVPVEAYALYELRRLIGGDAVVRIRGLRVDKPNRRARFLLEFTPYGDLESLMAKTWKSYFMIEDHLRADKDIDFTAIQKPVLKTKRPFIAEPFLWWTFECLATAGLLMEQGDINHHTLYQNNWPLILHLDYKIENVLVGTPSPTKFKGYPMPKLADFGLAAVVYSGDRRTADAFAPSGTLFCRPPEQVLHRYHGEDEPRIPDSKTNTWGTALVIWSLMEFEDGDHRIDWDPKRHEDPYWNNFDAARVVEPDFRAPAAAFYSEDLRQLVMDCLRFEQQDRPSFKQILRRIRAVTSGGPVDHARGLRDAPKATFTGAGILVHYKEDGWPLGALMKDVKRRRPVDGSEQRRLSDPPSDSDSDDDGNGGGGGPTGGDGGSSGGDGRSGVDDGGPGGGDGGPGGDGGSDEDDDDDDDDGPAGRGRRKFASKTVPGTGPEGPRADPTTHAGDGRDDTRKQAGAGKAAIKGKRRASGEAGPSKRPKRPRRACARYFAGTDV